MDGLDRSRRVRERVRKQREKREEAVRMALFFGAVLLAGLVVVLLVAPWVGDLISNLGT